MCSSLGDRVKNIKHTQVLHSVIVFLFSPRWRNRKQRLIRLKKWTEKWFYLPHSTGRTGQNPITHEKSEKTGKNPHQHHNSNFVPTSKKVGFFVPVARICSPRGTFSDRGTLRSKCRGQKKFPEGCNSGHRDETIWLFEMEVWTLFFAQWVKIKACLNFSWRKLATGNFHTNGHFSIWSWLHQEFDQYFSSMR